MKKIICFGEVLWDVFPTHKKIGGAPLNVAVRLQSFGNDVSLISRIGDDLDGEKIIEFLKEKGVNTNTVQVDPIQKTGSVTVMLDEEGSATYTIDFPRAWDHIAVDEKIVQQIEESDAFIYGSLAARNEFSKRSLFQFLKKAKFKVFDVNLRAPHYTEELLKEFMLVADFIKFNDEEITEIAEYLGAKSNNLEEHMRYISNVTNTPEICVTRGGNGAILLSNDKFYDHKGYPVKVANTVGAGDSFLASLIHCLLDRKPLGMAIDFACAVGGLVAQSEGANPELSMEEINSFRN